MSAPNQDIKLDIALPDVTRVDVVRSGRQITRDSLLWEIIKDRPFARSFAPKRKRLRPESTQAGR